MKRFIWVFDGMTLSHSGDWVQYTDHESTISALREENERLLAREIQYHEEVAILAKQHIESETKFCLAVVASSDLTKRVDTAERDALRYQWLRQAPANRNVIALGVPWVVMVRSEHSVPTVGACYERELDLLIDDALTPKEQGNG